MPQFIPWADHTEAMKHVSEELRNAPRIPMLCTLHDGACLTAENRGKWLMCAHAHANPYKSTCVQSFVSLPLLDHAIAVAVKNEICKESAS